MHRLVTAAGAAWLVAAAPAGSRPHFIDARLIAETATPKLGASVLIGVQMIPQPGWHGYWSNPGESGLAPTVQWKVPSGIHLGPLRHPAPTMMQVMGLTSILETDPKSVFRSQANRLKNLGL